MRSLDGYKVCWIKKGAAKKNKKTKVGASVFWARSLKEKATYSEGSPENSL